MALMKKVSVNRHIPIERMKAPNIFLQRGDDSLTLLRKRRNE